MNNALIISTERGTTTPSRWLAPAAFQPVQLLAASQCPIPQSAAPRKHRAHRFVVAVLATAAIALGGLAATHSTHASAATAPGTSASVTVDAGSNPNTAANKTITALALGGSTNSSATTSSAALPAVGVQH